MSIFTIFCRFSPFFIDFHDLRTFVAIYILSRFTHFFRNFFLAEIAFSATSHVFCMYGYNWSSSGENRKEDHEAQYFEYERDSRARITLLVQRKTEKETTPPQAQVASWPNSGIGQGSTCLVPPKQKGHFTFSFCADHYCLMN